MLPAVVWIIVFVVALLVLVKGADWLVEAAEKMGLAWGLSPFVVGVVIVGIGTSFPELFSSLAAVLNDATEIVVANAVGSNVANILLVVGLAAVIGKRLTVDKDLIDLDLPMLAIGTVLFLGVVYDGSVGLVEALLLLVAYGIQLLYTFSNQEQWTADDPLPERLIRPSFLNRMKKLMTPGSATHGDIKRPKVEMVDWTKLVVGIAGLILGAKFLIDSVVALSEIWQIATGAIAIIAVAFGTSLPELLVSAQAARKGKSEVALGNIFGSNAFNMLVVVGLPAVFADLQIDQPTLLIGVPAMLLATFLFIVSGISRKIHIWEGAMYVAGYILFTGKIFNLF